MKGETVEEITGAARVMREKAHRVHVESTTVLDTCGTGGDQKGTFNISTTCAFVVAGAGVPVAKHGNRSVSSQSGSADVLGALGVKVDAPRERVEACIDKIGIGFLFAPLLHEAMKYAVQPRRDIGIRTIFNLLGPLTNPAMATHQLIGLYSGELIGMIAHVLKNLGSHRAMVVHGVEGLDEISLCGPTRVAELRDGQVKEYVIEPEAVGLQAMPLGGSPQRQRGRERQRWYALCCRDSKGATRDVVLLNSGAALYVSGNAASIDEGMGLAAESIDSGKAQQKLEQLVPDDQRGLDSMIEFLATIVAHVKSQVEQRRREMPAVGFARSIRCSTHRRESFAASLTGISRRIIAEVKRASPSKGLIRENCDPVAIAQDYASHGASAISVLTEERFFQGSLSTLEQIRRTVNVPLLRKDFIVDPYQLTEARSYGADAVLFIAALLDPSLLQELREQATALSLDSLVEVHTEEELNVAVKAGSQVVGINNRDLRTFEVSLATTEKLAPLVPAGTLTVCESGIDSVEQIRRVEGLGIRVFLIGESLMRATQPGEKLQPAVGTIVVGHGNSSP